MPKICAATSDFDTYRKLNCRKTNLYFGSAMFWKQPYSDKVRPKVREEKGEVDSMTARCVDRLLQMRIARACPSPPGHTLDMRRVQRARAPCMTRSTGRLVALPVQKATCNIDKLMLYVVASFYNIGCTFSPRSFIVLLLYLCMLQA